MAGGEAISTCEKEIASVTWFPSNDSASQLCLLSIPTLGSRKDFTRKSLNPGALYCTVSSEVKQAFNWNEMQQYAIVCCTWIIVPECAGTGRLVQPTDHECKERYDEIKQALSRFLFR